MHTPTHISTCFHRKLLQIAIHYGNLLFSTAIYCFLWQSAVSAKFCQVRGILLNSARTVTMHGAGPINLTTISTIYTPFSLFLTFFLYIISWLYYIVHVYSLILSILLYIIAAYTYSITLYYIKPYPILSRPIYKIT